VERAALLWSAPGGTWPRYATDGWTWFVAHPYLARKAQRRRCEVQM